MGHFYVAGELGAETGRVMLGSLHREKLTISEVRRFANQSVKEKDSVHWNIPHLYHELLAGLRELSVYEEPVDCFSCHSWACDYLLFAPDGSLMTPTFHRSDPRTAAGMKEVLSKIPWETIYDETGVHRQARNTLFQLAAEKSRRLRKASHLLPIADGFNYLLSGVPRAEMSLASATQLYNPFTGTWSEQLLNALKLRPEIFSAVVPAGSKLGPLRPAVIKETHLEEAQVIASCSNELAAALAGLPVTTGESWAFLRTGTWATMGTQLVGPVISDEIRDLNFTNEMGRGGSVNFYKQVVGLWILEECKRFWKERDRELDDEVLKHLAISASPFESLINPNDPRFLTPGDMPLKIQAFCKETNQEVPRKPGPIFRCVLESLALHYRKTLHEIERLTGREFARLFVLGGSEDNLLFHFTANALQIPVTIAPANSACIGNVVVQALTLGHIPTLEHARDVVRNSFKQETIAPHSAVWNEAYDRLAELVAS